MFETFILFLLVLLCGAVTYLDSKGNADKEKEILDQQVDLISSNSKD